MSHADDVFIRTFIGVLGALVLFAVIAFVLGRVIGGIATEKSQHTQRAVAERIAPEADLRTLADKGKEPAPAPVVAAAPAAAAPAAAAKSGAEVYNSVCVACHMAGVAGAPKTDDTAAWKQRLDASGMDGLVASVVNGKNAMPPKGGNAALSDAEIRAAVEHVLSQAGVAAN